MKTFYAILHALLAVAVLAVSYSVAEYIDAQTYAITQAYEQPDTHK